MAEPATWKERLAAAIAPDLAREIDVFETEIELRRQGKIEEKLFAETRLRRGAYGQRYDNGQRHDGARTRALAYPSGALTKGPSTLWDAPGMQRIKVPFGAVTAAQMDALAEVAEEYADGVLHVTTRQDFQLHFVHIDDTPDLFRRLAAVGITTREACGNTVRNVTACPLAGVCPDECVDVTPYAKALALFLLGHPDTQDFGRKFKIAFSGCKSHGCGLTNFHDFGAIAVRRNGGGRATLGFELYVGGGLGSVPQAARLFDAFLAPEELLPIAQAVARVFARLGERKNRARARLKFLVGKLGIDEFRRLVIEERAKLPHDERWTSFLATLTAADGPRKPSELPPPSGDPPAPGYEAWRRTNVQPQKQAGYFVATVKYPLGDLTARQLRAIADLARRWTGDTVRTTVEQNLLFRWVKGEHLTDLHRALDALGLSGAGAGTIADVTACPGTDTCKLGISSSRGLAAELAGRLGRRSLPLAPEVERLHIKTSGCFNSCGQHHVADLGFLGVSRTAFGRRVPHFQVVLGGRWENNAGAYGLAIGAVPAKQAPEVVERLTATFVRDRRDGEDFASFVQRIGKARVREMIADLLEVPSYEAAPDFYRDWGDPREYTIGDLGQGECAGEVVPPIEFALAAAEREAFEAQILLESADAAGAARAALGAMLTAAKGLVRLKNPDAPDDAGAVVAEFRTRFLETRLFTDPYAGDKFAAYFLRAYESSRTEGFDAATIEAAHHRIEEAILFVDAAHACSARLRASA